VLFGPYVFRVLFRLSPLPHGLTFMLFRYTLRPWIAVRRFQMPGRAMLHLINRTLGEFGRDVSCRNLPHLSSECKVLADRRVVMVDDTAVVLQAYIPSLTVATLGQAKFVLHDAQRLDDLARQVLEHKPYAVLLDGQLAQDATGTDLARCLRHMRFRGHLVGFSTNPDAFKDQESQCLVDASVVKEFAKPEAVVGALALCLRVLEMRRRTN